MIDFENNERIRNETLDSVYSQLRMNTWARIRSEVQILATCFGVDEHDQKLEKELQCCIEKFIDDVESRCLHE